MENSKIKFLRLNVYVSNLDESIYFYQRLGFTFMEHGEGYGYEYADIILGSDFVMRLCRYYEGEACLSEVTISLAANEEAKISHREAYQNILDKGLRFLNLPIGKVLNTVAKVGILNDPDGHRIELVDDYEDGKYQELNEED